MSTLAKAIELAVRVHAGQVEKPAGTPYVLHPMRVMEQVEGEDTKIVAVLHDVVEDTDTTPVDLLRMGFSDAVVRGILSVSRREGETYADFVVRCKADALGRRVKLADLTDNFNLPRTLVRAASLERDLARLRRYVLSYKFLMEELSEGEYRAAMPAE